jgi:hypothetical protein
MARCSAGNRCTARPRLWSCATDPAASTTASVAAPAAIPSAARRAVPLGGGAGDRQRTRAGLFQDGVGPRAPIARARAYYDRARLIARSSWALVMVERPSIFKRFAWL